MKETEENKLHISEILEGDTFCSHPIFLIIFISWDKADFTSQGFVLNNTAKSGPMFLCFFQSCLSSNGCLSSSGSFLKLCTFTGRSIIAVSRGTAGTILEMLWEISF